MKISSFVLVSAFVLTLASAAPAVKESVGQEPVSIGKRGQTNILTIPIGAILAGLELLVVNSWGNDKPVDYEPFNLGK
jgi:hypothetical protein